MSKLSEHYLFRDCRAADVSLVRALFRGFFASAWELAVAEQKGARLLMTNLTSAQLQQYERYSYFDVTGSETGHRYRIRHGQIMNIDEFDANGSYIGKRCFFPVGNLVVGDILLAQKIALELFETEALAVANHSPPRKSNGTALARYLRCGAFPTYY
jgi:hypothetical protein